MKELEQLQQELMQRIEEVQRRFPKQYRRELRTSKAVLKGLEQLLKEARAKETQKQIA